MPSPTRPLDNKVLFTVILLLGIVGFTGPMRAAEDQKKLQLEVVINGVPRNVIGSFIQLAGGAMATTTNEIEELGINAGGRRFGKKVRCPVRADPNVASERDSLSQGAG